MWNVISLDGYFEGEKAWDLEFHDLAWGKELENFSIEQLKSADMVIYGEKTYQGMADYWSKAEGETADYMNKIPKVVCSSTLKTANRYLPPKRWAFPLMFYSNRSNDHKI